MVDVRVGLFKVIRNVRGRHDMHNMDAEIPTVDSQATNDTNGETVELPTPRMGQDGKPIYDQEFFLALARCGKDDWNRWRETNPEIKVTFEGIDFREPQNKDINFSKFQLGDDANFRACWFGNYADFSGAIFGERADLSAAIFGAMANLSGATFGREAKLSNVTFGDNADLSGAVFESGADLREATFGDNVTFTGANFEYHANFRGATFGIVVLFSGATFRGYADFSGATFGRGAHLMGASFGDAASFSGATFDVAAHLNCATFGYEASFSRATFGFNADFSGAIFGDYTHLDGATFGSVSFSGATFRDGVSFLGATFGADMTDLTAKSIEEWQELINLTVESIDLCWRISAFGKAETQSEPRLDEENARASRMKPWAEKPTLTDARPDAFTAVSFANAHFDGIVDFSGRKFSKRCDLTRALFRHPPIFDDCAGASRVDLYGATIRFSGRFPGRRRTTGWTTDSDVARRLRVLRKLADETKNHDLERDLYIEEHKAERGIKLAQLWTTKELSNLTYQFRAFESPVWFVIWFVMRTDWRKIPPVLIKLIDHWLWIRRHGWLLGSL
jgi:Pentapeptide repeats (9 copies)